MSSVAENFLKSSRILRSVHKHLNLIEENVINLFLRIKYIKRFLDEVNKIPATVDNLIFVNSVGKISNMVALICQEIEKVNGKVNSMDVAWTTTLYNENCTEFDEAVERLHNVNCLFVSIENQVAELKCDCTNFRKMINRITEMSADVVESEEYSKDVFVVHNLMRDFCAKIAHFNDHVNKNKNNNNGGGGERKRMPPSNDNDTKKKITILNSFMSMNFECPVCLECITMESMAIPECCISHAVCLECLEKLRKAKCPVCINSMKYCINFKKNGENISYKIICTGNEELDDDDDTNNNSDYGGNTSSSSDDDDDERRDPIWTHNTMYRNNFVYRDFRFRTRNNILTR